MRRVVELIISDGMNTEGQLFRVKKDVSVHFVPDVSLIGRHVRFFINYPNPENLKFKRLEYRELSMINPTISKLPADCFDNFFELAPLPISGSFHFYFTVDGSAPSTVDRKEKAKISGCGYLTVDPHFGTKPSAVETADGAVDRSWDLDGVVLQTYLPKNLGHFNEWESRLMTAKEGKYNMIHFTPLQELGYSGSAYSLRDQLKVNPTFTPPDATRPVDWTDVGNFLQHLENDWSVLSMADLVFNHTSNDSPWLHEHPECAFNVVNSPHLVPAYLLDFIVRRLTVETAAGNLASVGIPARLCNPSSEIPAMRTWLNAQIEKAHLDEFFLADIPTVKQEFVSWLSPLPISGSFHFYFTVDGSAPSTVDRKEKAKISGCGYLTVDPHFGTKPSAVETADGAVDRSWDLDGVVLQTYLPKNLGHFNEWESRLMTAKEGKYNMIHFTPLQHLENDWSVLSMADLVFNHTSNDSPWLHEHPECAFNVVNSPHLVPAYLLDFIVRRLTVETAAGNLASVGIPARLCNPSSEIPAMRTWLNAQIEKAHLDEFFLADIPTVKQEFVSWLLSAKSSIDSVSYVSRTDSLVLKVAGKRKGRRFGGMVDFKLARKLFVGVTDHSMPFTEAAATAAANRLGIKLEELNSSKSQEVASHLRAAVDNVIANANYRFYDPHGLKLETVTLDTPIMWSYFYQPAPNVTTLEEAEAVLDTPDAARIMAFNGWVINDNPLRNFAEPDSYVYLRRELVVWGDSVKLRYGDKREDCPYLWDRMADYTELTARLFHAVRLDNCHSTPLHVAQYMLDRARAIRPNLYVVAELFTNSEYQDNIFINKLGLNSLIRATETTEYASMVSAQKVASHNWLTNYIFVFMKLTCSANVIAVTRICPETRESVILVAHTAFNYDVVNQGRVDFKPIELGGEINRVLLEVQTVYTGTNRAESDYVRDSQFINGLPNVRFPFLENVDASESKMIRVERYSTKHGSQLDRLHFHNFPPGSVVVLSARLNESQEKAMVQLNAMLNTQFGFSLYKPRMSIKMGHGTKAYTPHVLSSRPSLIEANTLRMLLSELSLIDINRILFRCEVEELADGLNCGAYDVPGYGRLCYCGFESIAAIVEDIRDKNDLGHPICAHLRSGDWLANYLCDRLCTIPNNAENILSPALVQIGKTLKQLFAPLSDLPRYLVPAYFETLILSIRQLVHKEVGCYFTLSYFVK
ncbi:hypothetical protein AHF37_03479 [Paragonimus kellicotti]|nr:hypothetical protein AHF37_03479 [Paragonimus kellicotti]